MISLVSLQLVHNIDRCKRKNAQVNRGNVRHVHDVLGYGWLEPYIQYGCRLLTLHHDSIPENLLGPLFMFNVLQSASIIGMIWVSWIEKGEVGIGALIFADFVFKESWVCRASYYWRSAVNYSLYRMRQLVIEIYEEE